MNVARGVRTNVPERGSIDALPEPQGAEGVGEQRYVFREVPQNVQGVMTHDASVMCRSAAYR